MTNNIFNAVLAVIFCGITNGLLAAWLFPVFTPWAIMFLVALAYVESALMLWMYWKIK